MKPTLWRHCPNCKIYQQIEIKEGKLSCPNCQNEWGELQEPSQIFDSCPICSCRQFYTSKNFNQMTGCLIMSVGIILSFWTYGLSLPVFAFIDWLLYRKVPTIAICYKCGTEFHALNIPERLKPFMHHIGLKYDKYRK